MVEITQAEVRRNLSYDSDTGIFIILLSGWKTRIGKAAGSTDSHGYLQIRVNGHIYLAHRLAWLYVTGEWPSMAIDHKNGIKTDNRFCNLRLATNRQNGQNRWKAQSNNNTGLLGVSFDRTEGKHFAQIIDSGKRFFLGYFDTPELAHHAYLSAKARLHEFGDIAASYRPQARKEAEK